MVLQNAQQVNGNAMATGSPMPPHAHTLQAEGTAPMMRLLLLGVLALATSPARANPAAAIQCPGETTIDMRYCASKSLAQSDAQLRKKVSKRLMQQWQEATRAVCASAYAPYRDGTIYPQLLVGCEDQLNRELLKEFTPMDAR